MTLVHVVGIGLDGAAGLTKKVQHIVEGATLLVGSDRHLNYFPNHPAERLVLGDLHHAIQKIRRLLQSGSRSQSLASNCQIVVLVSGDPLFFGLGRLLLAELPAEQLIFHPHLSAVQLAFSRIKVPWQDARLISAHGRSLDDLTKALQEGAEKIAVLTDTTNTPGAIARLLLALDLPVEYDLWICENLGGATEQIETLTLDTLLDGAVEQLTKRMFAPLNVVVLLRSPRLAKSLNLQHLPTFGIPDHCFLSFGDRPGLMTKREVRLLVLGELALQSQQTVWDIGAGTGSVSIEIARLSPTSQIYAIEKTAAGISLIQQNSDRFQINTIHPIHGSAPDTLDPLPAPDRIFIGGSGGNLIKILDLCSQKLNPSGVIVLALATLEHLSTVFAWLDQQHTTARPWQHRLLQIQIARSLPIGSLTRLAPLNPVTLVTLNRL